MKFLVDECLSSLLAQAAAARYPGSSHVLWLGLGGKEDWQLMPVIWTATGPSLPAIPSTFAVQPSRWGRAANIRLSACTPGWCA